MSHAAKVLGVGCAALAVSSVVLYTQLERAEQRAEKARRDGEAGMAECRRDGDRLRADVVYLKSELAKARQAPPVPAPPPPEPSPPPAPPPKASGPTLSETAIVGVVSGGRAALQGCYERALKRNSALQVQALKLTLNFNVRPSGRVTHARVSPNYDRDMSDCMRKAIERWRFPGFAGKPQAVQAPVTLSPKGS